MSSPMTNYAMGRSDQELARLARQGEIMKPLTRRTFLDAGIAPGMRVLDLGSGAGDVCMLVSEMVGLEGSVVGIDVHPASVALARARAEQAGIANIEYVESDFCHYTADRPFDALVGRLVLLYQADPAAALVPLVKQLRPGASVAFIEPWFMPQPNPMSTVQRVANCMIETIRRTGAQLDAGPRLHRIFQAAGLPQPSMRFEMMMDGRPGSPVYQYIADTLASLLPKAIEFGIAQPGDFDPETLPRQMEAEFEHIGYAVCAAPLISAWTRVA